MTQHEAGHRTNLGTSLQWEMVPLKKPVAGLPGGDFAYLLKDYKFVVEQRYTGVKREMKRTFRIAPDEHALVWRMDYLDVAIWVALTSTHYKSPEAAADDLEKALRQGNTPWAKEADGGYDAGSVEYRDDNSKWENGEVVSRGEDPDSYEESGSQVPPPRTSLGQEVNEKGEPIESIERVAWDELAAKVAAFKAR
jgi:hypothetical protein